MFRPYRVMPEVASQGHAQRYSWEHMLRAFRGTCSTDCCLVDHILVNTWNEPGEICGPPQVATQVATTLLRDTCGEDLGFDHAWPALGRRPTSPIFNRTGPNATNTVILGRGRRGKGGICALIVRPNLPQKLIPDDLFLCNLEFSQISWSSFYDKMQGTRNSNS